MTSKCLIVCMCSLNKCLHVLKIFRITWASLVRGVITYFYKETLFLNESIYGIFLQLKQHWGFLKWSGGTFLWSGLHEVGISASFTLKSHSEALERHRSQDVPWEKFGTCKNSFRLDTKQHFSLPDPHRPHWGIFRDLSLKDTENTDTWTWCYKILLKLFY